MHISGIIEIIFCSELPLSIITLLISLRNSFIIFSFVILLLKYSINLFLPSSYVLSQDIFSKMEFNSMLFEEIGSLLSIIKINFNFYLK